jgi:hypothetical protein
MFKCATMLLVSAVLLQSNALAQETPTPQDWKTVSSRAAGETLIVKLKQGKTVKGALQSTSESSLVIGQSGESVELKRDEIASVAVVSGRKSAARTTLLGVAIGGGAGLGIGAGIGAATTSGDGVLATDERAIKAGIGTVVGAVGGGLIGYFVGRHRTSKSLIYEAAK